MNVIDGVPTAPRGTSIANEDETAVVLVVSLATPLVEMATWSAPGENNPEFGSDAKLIEGLVALPAANTPEVTV